MSSRLIIFALGTALAVTACADRWSAVGADGARFEDVMPVCRAQAAESARRQLPFFYDYDYGPPGMPPDSRRDIENRETAICLKQRGFTLHREPLL